MIDVSKLRAQAQFDLCHKGPTQVPTEALIELLDQLEEVEAKRDALAAYGARLRGLGQLVREAATDLAHIGTEELFDRAEKWDAALNDEPTTSLARRDAEKRAEGGEYIANVIGGAHDRKLALMRVAELRRQTTEGQPS